MDIITMGLTTMEKMSHQMEKSELKKLIGVNYMTSVKTIFN